MCEKVIILMLRLYVERIIERAADHLTQNVQHKKIVFSFSIYFGILLR